MTTTEVADVSTLLGRTIRDGILHYCGEYVDDIDIDAAETDLRKILDRNLTGLGLTLAGDTIYGEHGTDYNLDDIKDALQPDEQAFVAIIQRHDHGA